MTLQTARSGARDPRDADPESASVRELIIQLAEVEDALQHPGTGDADLITRERVIVEALHRHHVAFASRSTAIRLTGRVDATTGNAVLDRLLSALMPGRTLLVDLSGVDHLDRAGAEILEAARRQAQIIGGDLRVSGDGGSGPAGWRVASADDPRLVILDPVVPAKHEGPLGGNPCPLAGNP